MNRGRSFTTRFWYSFNIFRPSFQTPLTRVPIFGAIGTATTQLKWNQVDLNPGIFMSSIDEFTQKGDIGKIACRDIWDQTIVKFNRFGLNFAWGPHLSWAII